MYFIAGRLLFGGAGTINVNRLLVDELEVEIVADYDAEVVDVIAAEVATPVIEAEVVADIEAEVDC